MSRVTLEPLHSGEIRSQVFDFSSQCAVGETLSTSSVTAIVYSGADAATIFLTGATTSGQKLTQIFSAVFFTVGVVYLITATVTTNLGQTLQI